MSPDSDKAWFRINRGTNYRVRAPRTGEVDEIAQTMLPSGAEWDGGFKETAEAPFRVLVIKLPFGRIARLLTMSAATDDNDVSSLTLLSIALGARLAVH